MQLEGELFTVHEHIDFKGLNIIEFNGQIMSVYLTDWFIFDFNFLMTFDREKRQWLAPTFCTSVTFMQL